MLQLSSAHLWFVFLVLGLIFFNSQSTWFCFKSVYFSPIFTGYFFIFKCIKFSFSVCYFQKMKSLWIYFCCLLFLLILLFGALFPCVFCFILFLLWAVHFPWKFICGNPLRDGFTFSSSRDDSCLLLPTQDHLKLNSPFEVLGPHW